MAFEIITVLAATLYNAEKYAKSTIKRIANFTETQLHMQAV